MQHLMLTKNNTMKTITKGLLVLVTSILISSTLSAQKKAPDYGKDSATCVANLSTMSEFVKLKGDGYGLAYDAWSSVFRNCPGSSKNVYIHGKKVVAYQIKIAETDEIKEAFIDTLMLMYDKRIEHFGEESKVLGKKGVDLLKYRKTAIEEAYSILKLSLDKGGNKTDAAVLATLVTTSNVLFKAGKIEADEMIDNYLKSMEAINSQKQSAKTKKASESIEKNFAESGAADCEALISIFTPKYEANKTDLETLKKITELLDKAKCQESDLFAQASESLYAIEPSAKAGANLAMIFATRGEYEKAKEYYTKAIEQETDTELKAGYYFQLGAIASKEKDFPSVKKYGYEAVKLKPDYGKAYIMIGVAYASSNCGTTAFEKDAVYLVAVDKFAKAKSVDPSVSNEATKLINTYTSRFPDNEAAFFAGYTAGKSYTVGCWINETTTVRTR